MPLKCPNCSFENEADAQYCQNCGQPLDRICPNCKTPNIAAAKFCKNCGFNLAHAPTPIPNTALSALRQATPDALQQKIQLTKSQIIGERKLITVLFTDIVGSTAMAEKLDPEEWGKVIAGAHRQVSQIVYRYEGTIAQLLGDGVLAFFGAPITHEDDPRRAINAALDIQDSIAEYRRSLRAEKLVDNFEMRVGLNTGLVIVGNIGSDLHMEYLAVGDTVNLAARIQNAAEPNTILITENTRRLVAALFDFEDRGTIEVRGKTEPIHVYRVIREHKEAVPTRGIAGLSSPMVGRARELATLMQSVADLSAGQGSIISIIGEAGLGKSRLVMEWRALALKEKNKVPLRWILGRCLSYGSSMAFHLSASILRAAIGTTADSPEPETRAALRQMTEKFFGSEMKDIYPYLGYLLGVQLEPEMAAQVKQNEGAALKAMYSEATKRFLLAMARTTPTIIICEDIHWADASSVELSLQFLPIIAQAPLMTVLVTRPDIESSGWRMVTQADTMPGVGAIRLYLAPLPENDSRKLVSNLLGIESLPESIRQPVLTKAEGNPFFVEEVIRMMIDRHGLIRRNSHWETTSDFQTIEIPDTLQGVLAARIDRLPETVKRALQIASVIGRTFEVELLAQIVSKEERAALPGRLETLESSGLIRQVENAVTERYYFRHALLQDSAYESLLKQDRKQLHLAIGQAIERLYADRLDDFAVLLSTHYANAGDADKTFEYATRAGDSSMRLYAFAEARLHYTTALDALTRMPDSEENRRHRVDVMVNFVKVSYASDRPEKNLERLKQIEPIATALPAPGSKPGIDRLRLARIHYLLGRMHYLTNRPREAIGYYMQVLPVATELGDIELIAIPSSMLGRVALTQGQFGKAATLLSQAVEPLKKTGDAQELAVNIAYLGLALAQQGQYKAGLMEGERSRVLAEESKNLTSIALSHLFLCESYLVGGDWARVVEECRATLKATDQSGDRMTAYVALGFQAWAESRLGHHDDADRIFAKWETLAANLGGRLIVSDWFAAVKAELAFNAGRIEEALTLAERAVTLAKSVNGLYGEGIAQRVWGQALAAFDPNQWREAATHLAGSVQALDAGDARLEAARSHVALGTLLRDHNEHAAAREHFDKAIAQFAKSELVEELEQTRRLDDSSSE